MISADELFASEDQKVKVRVDGLVDQLPSCELFWQDQGDVFVRSHLPGGESGDLDQFCVEKTTVRDFEDRLAEIFKNSKVGEYERVRDQFTKVIMQYL